VRPDWFFFLPEVFSAVSRPIYTKVGMNVPSAWGSKRRERFLKVKEEVATSKKHRKIGQILASPVPRRHIFARCDALLKFFEKKIIFCDTMIPSS
jgi:hypothetical protein